VTDKTDFKELNLLSGELGCFIPPTLKRPKPNLEDVEIQLLLEGDFTTPQELHEFLLHKLYVV
jgi:hypothetical protein